MNIAIGSGKGGTGKTTLAVNLSHYLKNKPDIERQVSLIDCDVEAPNDKLFLNDPFLKEESIEDLRPEWNKDRCKGCGKCKEVCKYNAIARLPDKTLIFKELCHACGACHYMCPNNAISEESYEIGKLYKTEDDEDLFFVYGKLNIGEVASPSVVKAVKKNIKHKRINIIDAPPGTGCSVVATLDDTDFAILVTEPTPFGLHDLKLAALMTYKMKIPFGVVINRADKNDLIITDFLDKYQIPLLGKIPFNKKYAEAYSKGQILFKEYPELEENLNEIFYKTLDLKNSQPKEIEKTDFIKFKSEEEIDVNKYFTDKYKSRNIPENKKELMIISGKGGTGKTTVSAAFSVLAKERKNVSVFEDCDVDAADLHLLLNPEVLKDKDFSGGSVAVINSTACTGCGICVEKCRFDAIDYTADMKFKINKLKCEGCGFCALVCPHSAITEREEVNGREFISDTEYGPMAHAELGIAEENTGKLVASVRKESDEILDNLNSSLVIGDGPPGVGCPVIASITGINLGVVITEPTVSGMQDMVRVLQLTKHFNIRTKIIINKADLNLKMSKKIRLSAASFNSEIIAEIPFDKNINDALVNGKTIVEHGKGKALKEIKKAWNYINNNFL
ncbi:MAG: ATP-binding protein [Victivallales bacterium]|nr:ATP-binding protein [Victivallales bacterium]